MEGLVIPLLASFGLGSVVTSLVQAWLAGRSNAEDRRYSEKQAAYIGLLEAYHRAAVEGTPEAAKNFAYWQLRCELVGTHEIRKAIQDIIDTNDDPVGRNDAHERMKRAMRADLGIAR